MTPVFQFATLRDVDLLLTFMQQFYAIDNYSFKEHAARAALTRLVQDTGLGRVWLIYGNGEPIGYVVLTFGYSLEFHGRDAFIDELFVVAAWRHQGIGTSAVQFVTEACPALGVHALHLEVEHTNDVGQHVYRKAGFVDHHRYLLTRWIGEHEP